MTQMNRYAVYYAPRPGDFAHWAARWLGWDNLTGQPVDQPQVSGLPLPLPDLTVAPAKYGFHGTIRAPFRPAPGVGEAQIAAAVADLAGQLAPAGCGGLRLADLHGFLALVPDGDEAQIRALGAAVVQATDPLRAPLTEAEIARRNPERLPHRERQYLERWGYPYVLDAFRFHLTLTGPVTPDAAAGLMPVLAAQVAPVLPRPFVIEDLCLFGEDAQGRFHLLHRYPLTGGA